MSIGLISFELNASGGEQRQVLRLARGVRFHLGVCSLSVGRQPHQIWTACQ